MIGISTVVRAMGYRAESDIKGNNRFDTGVRPVVAVGTEYAFNKNWAGRVEYQWVSNVGNETRLAYQVMLVPLPLAVSIALASMTTREVTPAPAVAATPAPEPPAF